MSEGKEEILHKDLEKSKKDGEELNDFYSPDQPGNLVSFIQIPLHLIGPIIFDDESLLIPMATTDPKILEFVTLGAKAVAASAAYPQTLCCKPGIRTSITAKENMSSSPVCSFPSVLQSALCLEWVNSRKWQESWAINHPKLKEMTANVVGRLVYFSLSWRSEEEDEQEVANTLSSAGCITNMEAIGTDLFATVSLPSVENLSRHGAARMTTQARSLTLLGVHPSIIEDPDQRSQRFARILAVAVLAGELGSIGSEFSR
ncbi:unnamed protein product [Notodromas monacha]|uniref:Uncharacterized protein n=1 Tax=Notodromas monacha TaxID=399045 RepID=A0A7R9GGL7_9CRUS|nr:unnamed protein product [Notodromas monacha]CAG0920335.1 unnamed protein product [Notodromas monacha]